MPGSLLPPVPMVAIGRELGTGIVDAVDVAVVDSLVQVIYEATSKTSRTLIAFAESVEDNVAGIRGELEKVNGRLAKLAQDAIVTAYEKSLIGTPTYRLDAPRDNRRYAGGILLSILQSSNFVEYDENGLYIGDLEALNKGAKQWARLNYGAGAAGEGAAQSFTVQISNVDVFVLDEPGGTRPGFMIPAGRWKGGEFYPSSEEFHPSDIQYPNGTRGPRLPLGPNQAVGERLQKKKETRGIRGEHWLGAGLRVVAKQIGPMYLKVFEDIWAKADADTRIALAGDTGLQRIGKPIVR